VTAPPTPTVRFSLAAWPWLVSHVGLATKFWPPGGTPAWNRPRPVSASGG